MSRGMAVVLIATVIFLTWAVLDDIRKEKMWPVTPWMKFWAKWHVRRAEAHYRKFHRHHQRLRSLKERGDRMLKNFENNSDPNARVRGPW